MPQVRTQSLIPPSFVQALITYAEIKGEAGVQEIEDEFSALYAQMKAGLGSSVVSASANGKSFGYQVNATVEELFAAYGEALRQINDDGSAGVVSTYADFSELQR